MIAFRTKAQCLTYQAGRQTGLRTANEACDQLTEQLIAARAELQEARAEYAERIAAAREHFDKEAKAMRLELSEALAELDTLRLLMFNKWKPSETDRVQ